MSIDYVRKTYAMPWLKRGMDVLALGKPGKVTKVTHYVWVRLNDKPAAKPYHPDDVKQPHKTRDGNG